MPVDFTKQNKKTNVEYLRDHIKGNEEANEFLDAIQKELIDNNDKMFDLKDEITSESDRADEAEEENKILKEEAFYTDVIDVRMGPHDNIRWKAGNISCKSMMEELDDAISRGVPILKIENILRAL